MANVAVTSDAWTEISITSGTVQNISATADIELSAEQTDNSGVVLKPSEIYQWDNETIYARAVTESAGALRVVNFKKAAGGGGYVLPVASSSNLGGVKVGGGLDIDANGVLSAPVSYSTTEQKIGTWIDGKPLYKKTYICTSPDTARVSLAVETIDAGNNVKNISGVLLQTSDTVIPINFSYDIDFCICWVTAGAIKMQVTSSSYLSCPCYITLLYTKTAD